MTEPEKKYTDFTKPPKHKITKEDLIEALTSSGALKPGMKVNFDLAHPIGDHWPFTRHCRTWARGGWYHLWLVWDNQWKARLRRYTFCVVGRHRVIHHGNPTAVEGRHRIECQDCGICGWAVNR